MVVRGWDPPVGKMYCHPRAQRVGEDQAVRRTSQQIQGKAKAGHVWQEPRKEMVYSWGA